MTARTIYPNDHQDTASVLGELARDVRDLRRFEEAEALARESMLMLTRLYGPRHRETMISSQTLASVLREQGRKDEAEPLLRDAVATATTLFDDGHPMTLGARRSLASLLEDLKRFTEAFELRQTELASAVKARGEHDVYVALGLNGLGHHGLVTNQPSVAETYFLRALAVRQKIHPPDDWRICEARGMVGDARLRLGRFGDAEADLLSAYRRPAYAAGPCLRGNPGGPQAPRRAVRPLEPPRPGAALSRRRALIRPAIPGTASSPMSVFRRIRRDPLQESETPHMDTARYWRSQIVGIDERLPLLNGRLAPYIHLDNAASTPPLREVVEACNTSCPTTRAFTGGGFKSRVSTAAYDEAHDTIARFVGADPDTNTVIFGKNTTEAINKLACRYPLDRRTVVVISTVMEHHSNDLPWRGRAEVVRARVTAEAAWTKTTSIACSTSHGERVALLTVSGASNVTGFVQPVHRLARKAHAVGARILVDAAQLAPHRRIDVKPDDDPEHLDFVALVGSQDVRAVRHRRAHRPPRHVSDGRTRAPRAAARWTSSRRTEVHWAGLPDREEAGTPNVVGAIAMAVARAALMDAGMETLAEHESFVTAMLSSGWEPFPT